VGSGRSRAESLARLAVAYARHQARRLVKRRRDSPGVDRVTSLYAADRLQPLTAVERSLLPAMSRCINCGICALVAGRTGSAYVPDLSSAYLRALPKLNHAASDLGRADLQAAAAACPVGVPLPAVAAIVERLAQT
jgi:hypothetical protein